MGHRSASPCRSQSGPSMSDRLHVALIDDDAAVLDALSYYLARQAIRTSTFRAAKGFLDALDSHEQFDCVVSDVRMPGMSGLDLMKHLNERSFAGTVILITGHGDIAMAVGAIKNGAFDFIEKPFDEGRLLVSIRQGAERMRQEISRTPKTALNFPLRFLTMAPCTCPVRSTVVSTC